jgi:hypothetical protein
LIRPCGIGAFGQITQQRWLVRCRAPNPDREGGICGNEYETTYASLYYGTEFSCGCVKREVHLRRPSTDETGKVYGRLAVMEWLTNQGWRCVCGECGGDEIVRNSRHLEARGAKGCKYAERQRESRTRALEAAAQVNGQALYRVTARFRAAPERSFVVMLYGRNREEARQKFFEGIEVVVEFPDQPLA